MSGIDMNQAMAFLAAQQNQAGGAAAAPVVLTEEEKAEKRTQLVAAAKEASEALQQPENAAKILAAQTFAAGDMMKFFMMAIPVAVEILSPVVAKHGYSADQAGCMALVAELQKHKDDAEIKSMADKISKTFTPPPMQMPGMPAAPVDEGAD